MKRFKKAFLWYILLTKRLLKKPVFIIILALIPLLAAALNIVARQDSGVISVALAQENKNDELFSEIVSELLSENSLIRYTCCDTESAKTLLREGKVDSAWIFSDKLQEKTDNLVTNISKSNYLVEIIEREKTVPLLLAHEKLYGTMYKYCSESLYINFIRTNVRELDYTSDERLMQYYDEIHADGSLFEYQHINSNNTSETSYLVTPIRGIFSVLIILCGLATALFFTKDISKGVFSQVSLKSRPFVAAGYHFTSIILISAVSLISLFVIGIAVSPLREVVMALLYAFCCTVFCMIIRLICVNLKIFSVMMPVIVIALIAICPIFFDFEALRAIQIFLPPYYYIKAVYNDAYLLYMAVYCVISSFVYLLLCKVTKAV